MQYIDEESDGRSYAALEIMTHSGKTKFWQGPVKPYRDDDITDEFFFHIIHHVIYKMPLILHAKISHFI